MNFWPAAYHHKTIVKGFVLLWKAEFKCPKNFKPLKYEHIIYHFKARDLEMPLI